MSKDIRRALLIAKAKGGRLDLLGRPIEAHPAFSPQFARRDETAPTDDEYRGPYDTRKKVWANRPGPIVRGNHILDGKRVITPEDEVLEFPTREHAIDYIDRMVGYSSAITDRPYARGGSVHPASQIPGVHISERIHGKPIFTGERVAKADGGEIDDGEDGIIAYQGGPHSVGPEGYSNDKIGTGEGAQAYGYGHYFAEHEPVAQEYRDRLSHDPYTLYPVYKDTGEKVPFDTLGWDYVNDFFAGNQKYTPEGIERSKQQHRDRIEDLKKELEDRRESLRYAPNDQIAKNSVEATEGKIAERLAAIDLLDKTRPVVQGHMHQVRIQGRPEHFLDWDKPLSEQSDHVQNAVKSLSHFTQRERETLPIRTVYEMLGAPKEASERLSGAGVRGIRFLDQGSRSAGDGTRNYVVFDPKHIDILRRYARGGMAYADGGSVSHLPASIRRKMVDAYNETVPSVESQYRDWARDADDAALYKVTADDIESNYGEDDEIHPSDAEAIKIARQKGHVIAESRNGETTYHDPDKAPTLEQHMQSVVEDQGGKRPARDLSDLDYSHTSGIHDALMELAQHHGWRKQSTQGNKYFDLVHPQKGRIGVRIADHPNTSRQGPINRDAAEVNLNLAPKSRPDAPAHDLEDAARMLSAQNSGPRRAYADGGSTPDPAVQKALDLTRDLNPQGLYSHAAEAALASPQAKGPLPQMLASLKGVKPDELKYSGVNEQFAGQPRVTREDLAQHFQQSLPDIQETHFDDQGGIERETRYGKYTLPGGENYREILLHLPKDQRLAKKRYSVRTFLPMQYDTLEEAQQAYDAQMRIREERPDLWERMDEFPNDIVDNNPRHLYGQEYFRHSHWPVPNVLAHLRLKDRTGPNGEKILHVEEIQSDWGQHARKAGTYNPATPHEVFETTTGNVLSTHATEEEARAEAMKHRAAGNEGVDYGHVADKYRAEKPAPEAPYIGNTQNWTDLALKRLLHEAAAGGYDKVVWTPGTEQAKRYDKKDSSGMEGYYDKVVPKSLLALAKQHDPEAKLSEAEIKAGREKDLYDRYNYPGLLPSIYEADGLIRPVGQEWAVRTPYGDNLGQFPDRGYAEQLIRSHINFMLRNPDRPTKGERVVALPALDITPRMRESILKRGFKAYRRGGFAS